MQCLLPHCAMKGSVHSEQLQLKGAGWQCWQSDPPCCHQTTVLCSVLRHILQNVRFSLLSHNDWYFPGVEEWSMQSITVFKVQYNSYSFLHEQEEIKGLCIICGFVAKEINIPTTLWNWNESLTSPVTKTWNSTTEGWKLPFVTFHVAWESSSKEEGLKCRRRPRRWAAALRHSLAGCCRHKQSRAACWGLAGAAL